MSVFLFLEEVIFGKFKFSSSTALRVLRLDFQSDSKISVAKECIRKSVEYRISLFFSGLCFFD